MKGRRNSLVITLTITFVLMALLVVFTSRLIFRTAFTSVEELGNDRTTAISADLENYLDTAKSVLWLAADTVDHMVANGATDEEIVEYITRESANTEQQFDESYTGIYGVIGGNYVDGVGWTPPDDYDPTTRDWYKTTIAGGGDVVIVSPYVDAQTGNVIISVGRALSDGKSALALDLTLSGVQEIVEDIQINGYGYGFILNNDGLIIAHHDRDKNGLDFGVTAEENKLFSEIEGKKKGSFTATVDGKKCTVFVDTIMDQWYLVIVTKNSDLYRDPTYLLIISIIINLVVFALISVFYLLGYRSEQKFNAEMEELKEAERRKDYEAKILKLEKSAADSANKAKSNFLADMSHEIRTPINAVLGMNEMILHESKEEATLGYATSIKSAGTTLLSIINTILDFSKIEDGRMHLVPVEFETVGFVNGLVNSINERAKSKGLYLEVNVDDSVPSVLLGDDVRISQVIMNLLTNAVKYTEKGSILFNITNLGVEDGKVRLLVMVKDTGIGIRPEDIDKLSVSFERVDERRNRNIEGTGLGIAIVTKLLDMMGSKLQVKSEYGVGSEFSFELPVEVVNPEPIGAYKADKKNSIKASANSIGIKVNDAKVLLTDDNDMNRKVAANLLKLFGITPVICSSGGETIDKMWTEEFDIVFLDHMMPELDGIETLKVLRSKQLMGSAKIIALTANAVVGAREQYMEAGFDDYLSKPIDLAELEKMLKKYLPKGKVELLGNEQEIQETTTVENEAVSEISAHDLGENSDNYGTEDAEYCSGSGLEKLRELGLDTESGLTYCGGDEDFYLEIVGDYGASAEDKIKELAGYLSDGNFTEYKILIHSVKSSSKTIGAMELFKKARALEQAAGEANEEYLKANHDAVMNEFRELSEKLKTM
ncbi:MAG: response regulator [Lachnospiraceae bacterium]|nr:response regulator [Lachnospiraceae bacterium]